MAALLVLVVIKGFFTYFEGVWTEVASQNVAYDLRNEIQRKITLLSFSFHDQAEAGDLLSRAIQDVERIRFLTGRAMFRVIEGIFLMLITAVVDDLDESAAGAAGDCRHAAAGGPIHPLRTGLSARSPAQIQKQLAVLTTRVEQNLRGVRVVKTFAQEEAEIERFEVENRHWFDLSAFSARLQSTNMPLLNLIANISSVAILWYGGMLVIDSHLTLGELVAFTTYVAQLVTPVRYPGNDPASHCDGQGPQPNASSKSWIQCPMCAKSQASPALAVQRGHVRFEHVSFSYGKHSDVLKDITFEA